MSSQITTISTSWISEEVVCHISVVYLALFHMMDCFYVIYRYVFSEWTSIKSVKINQYEIIIGNNVARDIHCDVTMSNSIAICTYHGITMHNDVTMNLFILLCILCSMPNCVILLWVVWNNIIRTSEYLITFEHVE